MNLEFEPEEIAFRDEVRAFIQEAFDPRMRAMMAQSKNGYLDRENTVRWQKRLYERGWIAPDWPVEYGGTGWTATQRYIFDREIGLAGCPLVSPMGLRFVAHVIMKYGDEMQKQRFLPGILSSDILWCQGYSEPGAGSDLASLQMKAEFRDDRYVVTGSKIWTTHAQWADWIFCLVRTSNEGRPQQGVSFLLIDMRSPGVTVRPIAMLEGPMDGEQEVNEVFFDGVEVPIENRLGAEGEGWACARYLLQFERSITHGPRLQHHLSVLKGIAARERSDDGGRLIDDPDFRRKLAELDIRAAAMDATELRILSTMASGSPVGAASSMIKLVGADMEQAVSELALEAVGLYVQPFVRDTWADILGREAVSRVGPEYAAPVVATYFNYRKLSIYGGTNEIQRGILAKRILEL